MAATSFNDFILGDIKPVAPKTWGEIPSLDGGVNGALSLPNFITLGTGNTIGIDSNASPTSSYRVYKQVANPNNQWHTLLNVSGAGYLLWVLSTIDTVSYGASFRITVDGVLKSEASNAVTAMCGAIGLDGRRVLRRKEDTPNANMTDNQKAYCLAAIMQAGIKFDISLKIEISAYPNSNTLYGCADYVFDSEL